MLRGPLMPPAPALTADDFFSSVLMPDAYAPDLLAVLRLFWIIGLEDVPVAAGYR